MKFWYDNVEVEYNVIYRDVVIRVENGDEDTLFIGKDFKSVTLGYDNWVVLVSNVIKQILSYDCDEHNEGIKSLANSNDGDIIDNGEKEEENVLSWTGEYDIRWNVGDIISNTE